MLKFKKSCEKKKPSTSIRKLLYNKNKQNEKEKVATITKTTTNDITKTNSENNKKKFQL
jgi:hypothetical protein